jgi:hypothetical protein
MQVVAARLTALRSLQIIVFDDEQREDDEYPSEVEDESESESSSDEEEDGFEEEEQFEQEEEAEFGEEGEKKAKKAKKAKKVGGEEGEEGEDAEEEDAEVDPATDGAEVGEKRKMEVQSNSERREHARSVTSSTSSKERGHHFDSCSLCLGNAVADSKSITTVVRITACLYRA